MPVSVTENAITDFTRLRTGSSALQPEVARSIRSRTVPCSVNFSGVGEQVLEHLLQPLGVGDDRIRR